MAIDDVDRPGSDCTPWSGAIRSDGYGILGSSLAHRVVFAEVYGPIPVGMQIDHTCHDPETCDERDACPHRACVNPAHLRAVTPRANVERSNGPAAINMRKTHCPAGHPYDEANTRPIAKEGKRRCRICRAEQFRRARANQTARSAA